MAINTFQHKNIIQNIVRLRFWGESEDGTKNLFRMTILSGKVQVLKCSWKASTEGLQCNRIWSPFLWLLIQIFQETKGRGWQHFTFVFCSSSMGTNSMGTNSILLGCKALCFKPTLLFQSLSGLHIAELPCLLNMAKSCSSQESKVITLAVSLHCFSLGMI